MKNFFLTIVLVIFCSISEIKAQDPYIGEIRMFAGNFAPVNWAFCEGQILAISKYTALFSIVGTTYGGDGRTTFALPDLRGRVAIHPGRGNGLANYKLGQRGGKETVTLMIPSSSSPTVQESSTITVDKKKALTSDGLTVSSNVSELRNKTFDNRQPFLAVNYIICLNGVYPPRN